MNDKKSSLREYILWGASILATLMIGYYTIEYTSAKIERYLAEEKTKNCGIERRLDNKFP